jgi:protein TonB
MLVSFALAASFVAAQPGPVPAPAARRARFIAGAISEDDYPPAAVRAGAEGTVLVRYAIEPNGAVSRCQVVASSGSDELDSVSCAIVTRRFRFEPARGADGRPVGDSRTQRFLWRLPEPPPEPEDPVD